MIGNAPQNAHFSKRLDPFVTVGSISDPKKRNECRLLSCIVRSSIVRLSIVRSSLVRLSIVRPSILRSSIVRSSIVRSYQTFDHRYGRRPCNYECSILPGYEAVHVPSICARAVHPHVEIRTTSPTTYRIKLNIRGITLAGHTRTFRLS